MMYIKIGIHICRRGLLVAKFGKKEGQIIAEIK